MKSEAQWTSRTYIMGRAAQTTDMGRLSLAGAFEIAPVFETTYLPTLFRPKADEAGFLVDAEWSSRLALQIPGAIAITYACSSSGR